MVVGNNEMNISSGRSRCSWENDDKMNFIKVCDIEVLTTGEKLKLPSSGILRIIWY
jgi:hypothetical protein